MTNEGQRSDYCRDYCVTGKEKLREEEDEAE